MMKKIFFLLLVLSFGILFPSCEKSPQRLEGISLYADLDKNGENEQYALKDGRLTVTTHSGRVDSTVVWQSPPEWQVTGVVLADSTGDGVTDVNFSVWKAGDYGSSKPFWVKENDQSVKNHFFVFDFIDGKMKALWQSSNLPVPNCEFAFGDVDGDGKQNLVVLEGDYSDGVNLGESSAGKAGHACQGRYVAVWQWDQWGFVNISRSAVGHYKNLRIVKEDGMEKVMVDKS